MSRGGAAALVIAIALWASVAMAQPGPKVIYEPIVLTGDPLPAPLAGTFNSFPYHSVINDANRIVFLGSSRGPHSPPGVFLSDGNTVSHVAHSEQPAPGFAEGVVIQGVDINYHIANSQGQVVFESTLAGPDIDGTGDDDSNAFANWFWSGTELQPIAQYQTPAPGTDALFRTFGRTTLNDLGHVAFAGDLVGDSVGPGNDTAFWYGPPEDVRVLAREGSPAPGGITYGDMTGFDYPMLTPKGLVAFMTDVAGGGRAVFAGKADDLQLIAKTGDPVGDEVVTYGHIAGHGTPPRLNEKGEVIFVSFFSDGSRGLVIGSDDDATIVARTGENAPGLGEAKFDFFFDYGINDRGEIAFRAETRGKDATEVGSAIYAGRPDRLELIAADGLPAPGVEGDVRFWYFHDPVINRDGQVAFFATLTGPDSRGLDDYGLFATGHSGELRLIARYGDQFEVAPGDVRTIEALSHAGVHGTHIVTFNETSDLSMLIRFTDGSEGIFTARVLPEPGAVLWFSALALAALRRPRRR
jgi:hypothetical protein